MGVSAKRITKSQTIRIAICSAGVLFASTLSGNAQSADRAPPINPLQPGGSFDLHRVERSRSAKPAVRTPQIEIPEVHASSTPFMKLRAVSISGAHAIGESEMAGCYKQYVNVTISQADLVKIAGCITKLYRDAGFHLSRAIVPPQDIKNDEVAIRVIEGRVSDIVLKGDRAEQFGARTILEPITAENPSRLKTFARHLLLANDQAGMRVTDSALEEIGEMTGNFRLTVWVETWHVAANIGLDNLGSSAIGPLESYLTTIFNSYLAPGDSLLFTGGTAPNQPDELAFGLASYDAPVGSDGVRLGGTIWYSSVWPGNEQVTQTHIDSIAGELRGSVAAVETEAWALRLIAAAGAGQFIERYDAGSLYNDQVRTVRLEAANTFVDPLSGHDYLDVLFRQGLPILGASPSGDQFVSHAGASGTFSVTDIYFSRLQSFNDTWSFRLTGAAQFASAPLFYSQQLYLGGASFGRGFDAGEISGDNGAAGSFELRFDQASQLKPLRSYQLYAFVEGGAVWDHFDDEGVLSLLSGGVGARLNFDENFSGGVAVAFPLSYHTLTTQPQSPRFLFSLSQALKFCPEQSGIRCF
jgi:hemolysin activation/secretion protein